MTTLKPRKPAHSATPHMIGRARSLRRNATAEERLLWYRLRLMRPLGFHFRRQSPLGRYVLDFVCHENRIVVELDGSQHGASERAERDAERDQFLLKEGYRTIRIPNWHVKDDPDWVAGFVVQQAQEFSTGEGASKS